ncbi:sigma-70 family RNA polymerase sigma factor [Curtobacterium sp. MCBD17_034]|uniref:RNA polymerase sigma factor n=1 Tax=unclassified Curtobacterium TaxID=257496 RepID=UPI000DA8EBE5|nr:MULTISPECIES: sigma-70 family RNA polymerase sigma factor [unclassified Curtobacterium]PZF55454.1 sigma-70 family RNA polymerase sigma factor [Curtobacterium sp. MCBD17_034]PZM33235.1 sigma-70 family RNA polymerase sigma factor [Curtobacterium sp. MCBD17_031]WIB66782.1 sigma-70 family RNA polymerase sigma factor [Curtobacterium sp. MCBD17_035]
MEDEPDDGPLWVLAQRNDGAAFAALFDRHRPRVYRRATSLLQTPHDAEDVTAAAFYELWRKRRTVVLVAGSVVPWLLVTTVNLARNHRRATARYRRLLDELPRDDDTTPAVDAEDLEVRDRLRASVRALSPVDAALLVLTSLEGMPVWEAAQAVGLNPPAARVRLHRMRRRLRDDLHDLDPSIRTAPEGSNP